MYFLTESVVNRDTCRHGSDVAGETMSLHVCLGNTSLKILRKLQQIMSETGHEPESFPGGIILTSMFNDITDTGRRKVQGRCLESANEVATYAARFRLSYLCFCGPELEQTSKWK